MPAPAAAPRAVRDQATVEPPSRTAASLRLARSGLPALARALGARGPDFYRKWQVSSAGTGSADAGDLCASKPSRIERGPAHTRGHTGPVRGGRGGRIRADPNLHLPWLRKGKRRAQSTSTNLPPRRASIEAVVLYACADPYAISRSETASTPCSTSTITRIADIRWPGGTKQEAFERHPMLHRKAGRQGQCVGSWAARQ